jgi:integrase
MGEAEHKYVGSAMHDRIIGALETCCRRGEMLRIQNRHVNWERHQIAIPGRHAKDAENRRIPFDRLSMDCPWTLRKVARPAGLVHARTERREVGRELRACRGETAREASWRARQYSNLRPPA